MRENLRKPVYGCLYYGTEAFCLLFGLLVGLLSLFAFLFFGKLWLQRLISENPLWEKVAFFGLDFLLVLIPFIILWKILPLFRNFKEISARKTEKMAFVLGVLAWKISDNILDAAFPEWSPGSRSFHISDRPFEGWTIWTSLMIGCCTYYLARFILTLVGQRLQACDPKPEYPASPGEAPQGNEETV